MKYKILGIGKLQTKATRDNEELRKSFKHTKRNKVRYEEKYFTLKKNIIT